MHFCEQLSLDLVHVVCNVTYQHFFKLLVYLVSLAKVLCNLVRFVVLENQNVFSAFVTQVHCQSEQLPSSRIRNRSHV